MQLDPLLAQLGKRCASLLLSLALTSCTLTTDLDFVANASNTDNDQPDANATAMNDASVGDAQTSDAMSLQTETSSGATAATTSGGTFLLPDAALPWSDANPSVQLEGGVILDASLTDAAAKDAASDGSRRDANAASCMPATNLLRESYEGDLNEWSAVNWQNTECQKTDVATDVAVTGSHSVRSRIDCSSEIDQLHFTSVQLVHDTNPPTAIDAPNGVLLSFSAWLSVGYDFDADTWLDFARFGGSCDRTDEPLAIGLNDPARYLSVSHFASEQTIVNSDQQFPLTAWARIDMYVNYATSSLAVWQDGVLITTASFERESANVCYLEFGTMAAAANSDVVSFQDDVRLSVLEAPIVEFSKPPVLCE